MAIVFVHGVNNRKADVDYAEGVSKKTAFLQKIFGHSTGNAASAENVLFPYWGDLAARFRYEHASLPTSSESLSITGSDSAVEISLFVDEARLHGPVLLAELAYKHGLDAAVDVAWDAVAVSAAGSDAQTIASLWEVINDYLQSASSYAWLRDGMSNEEFVDQLLKAAAAVEPNVDSLSLGSWWVKAKETVNRIGRGPDDALGTVLTSIGRTRLHKTAARFIGDILVYMNERGDADNPGEIVKCVLAALRDGRAIADGREEELVVIGHSLGGVIVRDILTHFAPDLSVDTLITVGSQVGVFEEMGLYRKRSDSKPPALVEAAPNVGRWLNVYDTNDIFSFATSKIFASAEDFSYDTGYGLLSAHGGYFTRPSFYSRLGDRLRTGK